MLKKKQVRKRDSIPKKVARNLKVAKIFINPKMSKAASITAVGSIVANMVLSLKNEWKTMAIAYTGMGIASFGIGTGMISIETQRKMLGKLIGNPKIGAEVIKQTKNKKIRSLVRFFSQTKFIPVKEKQELARRVLSGDKKAMAEIEVAKSLYNSYLQHPETTAKVMKIMSNDFGGNNPNARICAAGTIQAIIDLAKNGNYFEMNLDYKSSHGISQLNIAGGSRMINNKRVTKITVKKKIRPELN